MNTASRTLAPLLDKLLARYLQADPPLVAATLAALAGKVIGLSLTIPELRFFLLLRHDTLQVCADYDGEPDTWIRGSVFDLLRLSVAESSGAAVHLEIVGDVHLGQKLQQLFNEIEFDWEELLVPLFGDIGAHQLGEGARATAHFLGRSIESLAYSGGEFLRAELRIAPSPEELDDFIDGVEQLRDSVERLGARLDRLAP